MLKSVIGQPVWKTGHILKYSLLLPASQRVYLLAKPFFPFSAPLWPPFGSKFNVDPKGGLVFNAMYFRLSALGRLFRSTFAENDNLITTDIPNN